MARINLRVLHTGWALMLLASGCVTPGAKLQPSLATTPAKGGVSAGATLPNAGRLIGVLSGPSPGLIANNGSGLIANNGGGVISDNALGLIANNSAGLGAGRFGLAAIAEHTTPLAGMKVQAFDLEGRVLSKTPAVTGADGAYQLKGLAASGPVVVLKASYEQGGFTVTLSALVAAPRQTGDLDAPIDPATTLIAKTLQSAAAQGKLRLDKDTPAKARAIAARLAPELGAKAVAAIAVLSDTETARVFDAIAHSRAALSDDLTALTRGSGLAALVAPLAAPASPTPAALSPSPSPSPSPSTSPISSGGGSRPRATPTPPLLGLASLFAGDGTAGFVEDVGIAARLSGPEGMVVDPSGNLLVADSDNHRIRRIAPDGTVTTFAGTGQAGLVGGDRLTAAQFNAPRSLAFGTAGTLYVADTFNGRVRRIAADGQVTTLVDANGAEIDFAGPEALVVDGAGTVYVGESNAHRIRRITAAGVASVFAGTGAAGHAEGDGPTAQFDWPEGLVSDGAGNLLVMDRYNHRIRRITASGVVSTWAGAEAGDAVGDLSTVRFREPTEAAFDKQGNLYVCDSGNHRIVKITPAGTATSLAGGLEGDAVGTGAEARFTFAEGVAVDRDGSLFVSDYAVHRIKRVR